jgi:hypothetical protein
MAQIAILASFARWYSTTSICGTWRRPWSSALQVLYVYCTITFDERLHERHRSGVGCFYQNQNMSTFGQT